MSLTVFVVFFRTSGSDLSSGHMVPEWAWPKRLSHSAAKRVRLTQIANPSSVCSEKNTASPSSVTCFNALAGVAMDFYINLRVNFRGNSKNFLLSGSETKSWESMEAMVREARCQTAAVAASHTQSRCSYRCWLLT